jgi:hypothetical protein
MVDTRREHVQEHCRAGALRADHGHAQVLSRCSGRTRRANYAYKQDNGLLTSEWPDLLQYAQQSSSAHCSTTWPPLTRKRLMPFSSTERPVAGTPAMFASAGRAT